MPAVVSPHAVTVERLLLAWQLQPLALASLALELGLASAYLAGVGRVQRRGRGWSRWKTASFLGGLAAIMVAVNSGLASYDDSVFTMHVVQHLILMSTAPPLLALGSPVTLLLQASSRRTKRVVLKVLHSRTARVLSFPLVGLALATVVMYGYFLTPLYGASLTHPLLHDATHVVFLAAGSLYWWPIVGTDPIPRRMGVGARMASLGLAIPFNAFLGIAVMSMSSPIAPRYSLGDTQAGGALLWGLGELFTLGALGVLFLEWAKVEERKAAREDRRLDAARLSASSAAGRGRTEIADRP